MASGTQHGFDKKRRFVPLFNFSVQFELNSSFYALEECTIVYDRTKGGGGFLPLQISVVERRDRESGLLILHPKQSRFYWNLREITGTESVTFPPSFPAAPGRPWSPGGPGGPGCPLSPLGPVPPVGPCRQHETTIKSLIMLHPGEDGLQAAEITERICEKLLTVGVLRLYLWSNHPSRSWWSCFSLETLERKRDAAD